MFNYRYPFFFAPRNFNHKNQVSTGIYTVPRREKKGSEMGSSIRVWGVMITVFVAMMFAQNATGQSLYACWGGCYNVCFLLDGKPPAERYPCYLNCLASCFPQSALENQLYYCHVGCSVQRCLELKNASAREKCFGSCGDVCKT